MVPHIVTSNIPMFTVLQVVQVPQLHVPLDVYPGVVRSLISKFASEDEGTRGIIFVGSLDRCDKLFDALVANVPSWECRFVKYHAGDTMTDQEKLKSLAAFHSRSLYPVVMIATTAAGASLDEPWVRFTLHDGIVYGDENLAQETGRAGRDGRPALCILFAAGGTTSRFLQLQAKAGSDPRVRALHTLWPAAKTASLQVALQTFGFGLKPDTGELS